MSFYVCIVARPAFLESSSVIWFIRITCFFFFAFIFASDRMTVEATPFLEPIV